MIGPGEQEYLDALTNAGNEVLAKGQVPEGLSEKLGSYLDRFQNAQITEKKRRLGEISLKLGTTKNEVEFGNLMAERKTLIKEIQGLVIQLGSRQEVRV